MQWVSLTIICSLSLFNVITCFSSLFWICYLLIHYIFLLFSYMESFHYFLMQWIESKQEKAMRCNNRDNFLQLIFSLKISIFSEAYI